MPRSPSGVYSAPPGTTAVSGQTISSAAYNSLKDDLVQDANTPRPVVAGGTGANNEEAARENLGVYGRSLRVDTSGITVGPSDDNQVIDFTGTGTLITDPAGDLGDGWRCYVFASGGDVTINPNVDETVNGETTLLIPEGRSGILSVYDGNFRFEFYGEPRRSCFMANKNGTGQNTNSGTKVTFTNEVFDVGEYYDTTNSRWMPPEGIYRISASLGHGISKNEDFVLHLYKNGASIATSVCRRIVVTDSSTPILTGITTSLTTLVEANGTDYFEIFYIASSGGSYSIDGQTVRTWFCGEAI